jgi:hypothetical protein
MSDSTPANPLDEMYPPRTVTPAELRAAATDCLSAIEGLLAQHGAEGFTRFRPAHVSGCVDLAAAARQLLAAADLIAWRAQQ